MLRAAVWSGTIIAAKIAENSKNTQGMAKKGFIRIRDKMSFRGINILFPYECGPSFLSKQNFSIVGAHPQIPLGRGCGMQRRQTGQERNSWRAGGEKLRGEG